MEKLAGKYNRSFLIIISILGWLALIVQLYLIILNRVASVPETIIRYFSFFTILTNILVAVCCTALLLKRNSKLNAFFSHTKTLTAIALYIIIVGLVYNLILRFLWKPEGLQLLVDELLHTVIPLLFIFFWIFFVPKTNLKWKDIFPWLLYPFGYIIYILIRGAFSGFYPYPFINVKELGYNKVFINSGLLVVVFVIVALLFVAVDRILKRS